MDFIRLPSFPSVAASAESTLVTSDLLGRSVHGLIFKRGGTAFTNAHLAGIRIAVDGKELTPSDLTGAQVVDINEYEGQPDVTNYTAWFLGDPTARTIRGQHLGDLDLSIYQKPLEINVNIGAATAPTLEVIAVCGPPKLSMGVGFDAKEAATVRALIRTQIQFNAAITRKAFGLSLGSSAGARWRRAFLFHTNLTAVELKKQSQVKHDDLTIAENAAIAQQYARTPQSGLYTLDRVLDGNQGEAEDTVNPQSGQPWNLELKLTASAGDTVNAYADLHTQLARI
jgi:hypothetical protein